MSNGSEPLIGRHMQVRVLSLNVTWLCGGMADALVLGTSLARGAGSNPVTATYDQF